MYTLEHINEAMRLDLQSNGRHYSLQSELAGLTWPSLGSVLDVGCGSGVLCRHIARWHPRLKPHGVDRSKQQIEFARRLSPDIHYETLDVLASDPGALGRRFDVIVNRYVAHHLGEANFVRALRWMRSHLQPDGMIVVIDVDGALVNLVTSNESLRDQIRRVASSFPGDLHLARRIPHILRSEGFSAVDHRFETLDIQGADLEFECRLYEQRFTSARPLLEQALGSELDDFVRGFVDELRTLGIVYEKVIATARP
jgi:cyclopropane fatty-acyl-phospholipid synthase-like methyltransferase